MNFKEMIEGVFSEKNVIDATIPNNDLNKTYIHKRIPQKLQTNGIRFILINQCEKAPFEKGWTDTNNYKCDDIKLFNHLEKGGNYGVLCGCDNLLVVDFDDKSVQDAVEPLLPRTFTVKTGTGKHHLYYRCKSIDKKFSISNADGKTLVDFQSTRTQVVAPTSIHPNGNEYTVDIDEEISEIDEVSLHFAFKGYDYQKQKPKIEKNQQVLSSDDEISLDTLSKRIIKKLNVIDVMKYYNYDLTKNPTMCKQGHDSGGGKCLHYDMEKNVWCCFHCRKINAKPSGGNAIHMIQMMEKCTYTEAQVKAINMFGLNFDELKGSVSIIQYFENAKKFHSEIPYFYDESGEFWIWDKHEYRYTIIDEVAIISMIDEMFFGEDTRILSSKHYNKYLMAFKIIGRRNKPKETPIDWIQFRNQVFDIKTHDIFPVSPEYLFVNPIPHELSDMSVCPTIDKLFVDWVGEEKKNILYEMVAYCCYPSYPIHKVFCMIGTGKNGKCLVADELVHMADGSIKKVQDVQEGNWVLSPQHDGLVIPARVKNIHSHFEIDVYNIRQLARDKRILYSCSGEHEVPIIRTKRPRYKDGKRGHKRILTHYSAKKLSELKLENSKSGICTFTTTRIDRYDDRLNSDINPYSLGVIIGDGCTRGNNGHAISISTPEKEIQEYFMKNHIVTSIINKDVGCSCILLSSKDKLRDQLEKNGLMNKLAGDKFIPKECLLSDANYRLNLLAGLLDTDGYIHTDGAISYCTKSEQLAKDVRALCMSLGIPSNINGVWKKCQGWSEKKKYYNVSVQFNSFDIPMRVKHKVDKIFNKNRKFDKRNICVVVEKNTPQMVYGFEVESPSKWFIVNDWVVTHNSCYQRILTNFLGSFNVVSSELHELASNRFAKYALYKKLAVTMGETEFTELKNTSTLKQLTGQDTVSFEKKFKCQINGVNYAKLFVNTNSLPPCDDVTDGFFRRWMIINWDNQFPQGKDVVMTIPYVEYQNLARKVVEILPDLIKRGNFLFEKSIEENKKDYQLASNPLPIFIDEMCDKSDVNSFVIYGDLYGEYVRYLELNGRRIISQIFFGRQLVQMGFDKKLRRVENKEAGSYINAWVIEGIRLKKSLDKNDTTPEKNTGQSMLVEENKEFLVDVDDYIKSNIIV
jgi:phage/plasmid-associated DNA primase